MCREGEFRSAECQGDNRKEMTFNGKGEDQNLLSHVAEEGTPTDSIRLRSGQASRPLFYLDWECC